METDLHLKSNKLLSSVVVRPDFSSFNPINSFPARSPAKTGGLENKQLGAGSQVGLLFISVLLGIVVLVLVTMLMQQMPYPS
ncbi:MAG: hypothetical protein KME46_14955 [Brasilonema angustatum HA4187-MV1]|jgi:hypothetical protein|nr:hypothetical protein [Brasilonema angustatum HA4187-MV1]